MTTKVLLVEDDPSARFGYSRYLTRAGYDVTEAGSVAEARAMVQARYFQAMVLDVILPDGSGLDLLKEVKTVYPCLSVIMATGKGDIPMAVEAMRLGADNFLTKPVKMEELEVYLRKGVELEQLRRGALRSRLQERAPEPYAGVGPSMSMVLDLAAEAARGDVPILLLGETGTGKGVLARWIHAQSQRREAGFVEVNCSGLRGELLANELFGHARGAFTSAESEKQGLLDLADGGTLFLDEIGDMDLAVQAQFLKVIEERSFRRLGETRARRSDFRLLCATNKDLAAEREAGRFRDDLYFRIDVLPLRLPSLRERIEDLPGLARHLLLSLGRPEVEIGEAALALLRGYAWPGNLRELRNMLERAVILSRGGPLLTEHFPGIVSHCPPGPGWREDLERQHLDATLARAGGDVRKAAAELGISRATLYRKLKRHRPAP